MNSLLIQTNTHPELVAHMAGPDMLGFVGDSCGKCRKSINRAVSRFDVGWFCPGCGDFNTTGSYAMLPHLRPAFGPSQMQIQLAGATARLPETVEALSVPEGMWTICFRSIENASGEMVRDEVEEGRWYYAVTPLRFKDNHTVKVDAMGLFWARRKDDSEELFPINPARSPEAAALIYNQLGKEPWKDELALAELLRTTEESITADRTVEGYQPRSIGVYQYSKGSDEGTTSRKLQLGFALAAASLGLRVGILLPRVMGSQEQLAALVSLAGEINADIPVDAIDALNAPRAGGVSREGMVTLVTADALQKIRSIPQIWLPDVFDVVITPAGYRGSPTWALDDLSRYFTQARLLAIWTSRPPAQEVMVESTTHAGFISIFDAKYFGVESPPMSLNEFYRRSTGLPFSRVEPGYAEFAFIMESPPCALHSGPALRSAKTQDLVEEIYTSLPPLPELKVATISLVEDDPISLECGMTPGDVESGMYIYVPLRFPAQCVVVHTLLGYYARSVDGRVEEKFRVWPAATVAAAESEYRRVYTDALFSDKGIVPMCIGSKTTRGGPAAESENKVGFTDEELSQET